MDEVLQKAVDDYHRLCRMKGVDATETLILREKLQKFSKLAWRPGQVGTNGPPPTIPPDEGSDHEGEPPFKPGDRVLHTGANPLLSGRRGTVAQDWKRPGPLGFNVMVHYDHRPLGDEPVSTAREHLEKL